MTDHIQRKFTWKRDPNYGKGANFKKFSRATKLPPTTPDLSANYNIPCYDQGTLGSCTAHAWTFGIQFEENKQNVPNACTTSRLAFYQGELTKDGNFGQDVGSTLTTGQWVCQNVGAASEALWPYDVNNFGVQPPANYLAAASKQKGLVFSPIEQKLGSLKVALCEGFPIMCGFNVYPEFVTDDVTNTGVVPNPKAGEKSIGGHAIAIVQMDDTTQTALIRNSWGTNWGKANASGQRGYFTVSYAYLLSHEFSDFWILETLNEVAPVAPTTTVVPTTVAPSTSSSFLSSIFPTNITVPISTPEVITPIKPDPNLQMYGHYVPFPDPKTGPYWILVYTQTPPNN